MPDSTPIILPEAAYFDANALVAAPRTLATQPLAEISEIARMISLKLFVPQLAAQEWLARCCADAVKTMDRIEAGADVLGRMLGRDALLIERIGKDELRKAVSSVQAQRLTSVGFEIVPTPRIELPDIISLFLAKAPPFDDGDRGFKDAIILATILNHACHLCKFDHIVLVTSDTVFAHRSVAQRFLDVGTELHLVDGSPDQLLPRAAEKLRAMIDAVKRDLLIQRLELAREFVCQHEDVIFSHVMKNAPLSLSLLKGYWQGRERDFNDQRLDYSTIRSIDAIRPKMIKSAFPMLSDESRDGRVSMLISVVIEIDLTIESLNVFAEPTVPLEDASHLLRENLSWRPPRQEESLTVERTLSVQASAVLMGLESGQWHFSDLRLEGSKASHEPPQTTDSG